MSTKIKNMGQATVKFNEGIIVTGSVSNRDGTEEDGFCLISSGSILITDGHDIVFQKSADEVSFIKFAEDGDPISYNASLGYSQAEFIYISPGRGGDFYIQSRTTSGGDPHTYPFRIHDDGTAKFEKGQDSSSNSTADLAGDVAFYVSGSGDDQNNAVFGGNLVVSGTITGRYAPEIPGNIVMLKASEHYFITTDQDVETKIMAPDENIFFSGSIGSKDTITKGTAVFGGDVVTSGSFVIEGRTSFEDYMIISVSADNTDLQTGTGLVTLRAPFAMDLYQPPRASLSTNGTSQTTIDINVGGSTIMNVNKLIIDANEGTSTSASTAAALTTTTINDDQQITIDVDAAGTGARGLKVTLYYRRNF